MSIKDACCRVRNGLTCDQQKRFNTLPGSSGEDFYWPDGDTSEEDTLDKYYEFLRRHVHRIYLSVVFFCRYINMTEPLKGIDEV